MCCFPFFAFFPFRVKNPPDRFPYVTLFLIAVNILIYFFTINWTIGKNFMSVTNDAVRVLGVSHENMNPVRLITSMFLHSGFLHIAGNMLFLWLFGPSVEGRLRPLKFIGLYFASGIIGALCFDLLVGILDPSMPSMGASGAIMGLAGAYLYIFPYATFRVAWWAWFYSLIPRFGVWEWQARWIVTLYLGLNAVGAVDPAAKGLAGGVGYICHLGGMGAGFLICLMLRPRRDTEEIAAAQAVRADAHDFDLLSVYELEALLQHPAEDMKLVIAFCEKSLTAPGGLGEQRCLWAIQTYSRELIETADQPRLGAILLSFSPDFARSIPSIFFLRMGSNLEHLHNYDIAVRIYRRLWEINPTHSDTEVALSRLGRLMLQVYRSAEHARFYLSELVRLHPNGRLAEEARGTLATLPYSDTPYRY